MLSRRYQNNTIFTYRTGYIPQIKVDEIVNLNVRIPTISKSDIWVCYGRCLENLPIKYKDISEAGKEEVKKYNKKFHPEDWFFYLSFWKMDKKQVRNMGDLDQYNRELYERIAIIGEANTLDLWLKGKNYVKNGVTNGRM